MEEKVLELYAFASSLEEEKKHREKFPALASRRPTKKAEMQGAFKRPKLSASDIFEGNGWRYLRTPSANSSCEIGFVRDGGSLSFGHSHYNDSGACVAFRAIYNPKSNMITYLKTQNITSSACDDKGYPVIITTRNVPIVTFGGKEYVWFNREECERSYASGESALMDCESLYLEECAEAIDETGNSNDYAVATKQQKQYERILLENATGEEKALLCKMRMSSKDNYESLEIVPPERDIQKILGQIATQEKIIDDAYTILKDLHQKLALATGNALNLGETTENKQKDDEAE